VARADYTEAQADPELTTDKPRMVYRYNPATGRKQRVADTSDEATEWSSRKPSRGIAGILQRGYQTGGTEGAKLVATKTVERTLRQSSRRVNTAAKKIAKRVVGGAGALVPGLTVPTAAGILAAGLIAYGLGKEAFYPQKTLGARLDKALQNYLAVRRHLAKQLGRPLTKDELRAVHNQYVETVVRLKAHDPFTYQRAGRE